MSIELFEATIDRRSLLRAAGISTAGLVGASLLAGCGGSGSSSSSSSSNDASILGAALIAEALATTMYTALIASSLFTGLSVADQAYLTGARDEEKYHYDFLKGATGGKDAQLTYYFPTGMFTDAQTTMNTLITLEDAFIAAYLIGVDQFSTSGLRVAAAQIMGVESDHRSLGRVVANDLGLSQTTGLSGSAEQVNPANDNVFERRYGVTQLSQVVTALTPFLTGNSSFTVTETFNPAYEPTGTGLYNLNGSG